PVSWSFVWLRNSISSFLPDMPDMFAGLGTAPGIDLGNGVLAGQVDPALVVDLHHLDPGHVADIQHIFHLLHPAVVQLGDVDQSILTGGDFHKGAEAHDAHHFAIEDVANLRVLDNGQDGLLGGVAVGGVDSSNAHRAV